MPPRILVVEDEPDLLDTVDFNLRREGYDTVLARNGADALAVLSRPPLPNLVMLDINLPDLSGLDLCRRLHQRADTKHILVLMATARGTTEDRETGLELGADDYVTKPFSVRELMLRVRALLRRAQPRPQQPRIEFGRLLVDKSAHRVFVDNKEVALTALEFRLLTTLMKNPGAAHSREQLLATVWEIQTDVETRTVDTHVKRLRNKLGSANQYIETVRGVGYRFRATPND